LRRNIRRSQGIKAAIPALRADRHIFAKIARIAQFAACKFVEVAYFPMGVGKDDARFVRIGDTRNALLKTIYC
jgi:hypothetical protein